MVVACLTSAALGSRVRSPPVKDGTSIAVVYDLMAKTRYRVLACLGVTLAIATLRNLTSHVGADGSLAIQAHRD
eukprot:2043369-Amphidinium_carterae.3